jgi:hypothetical protein
MIDFRERNDRGYGDGWREREGKRKRKAVTFFAFSYICIYTYML